MIGLRPGPAALGRLINAVLGAEGSRFAADCVCPWIKSPLLSNHDTVSNVGSLASAGTLHVTLAVDFASSNPPLRSPVLRTTIPIG